MHLVGRREARARPPLALPGLVSFVGEFLVLLGSFEYNIWIGAAATLGIVITAAYVLRLYQRTMTGPTNPQVAGMRDLNGREITALVPIAALTIVLGLFPAPLTNVITPAGDLMLALSEHMPDIDLVQGGDQ